MLLNWTSLVRSMLNRRSPKLASVGCRHPRKRRGLVSKVELFETRYMLSTVSAIATDSFAVEGASTGTIVFTRDGNLSQPLSLSYGVSGTATAGLDYNPLSGTVTIPAGSASAPVVVDPINDGIAEATRSVTVTLGAVPGYSVDLSSATVSIRDAFDGAGVDALVPLSETFSLHSVPGVHHTIYLDFVGGAVQDPSWNGGSVIHVNPFNLDGISAFSNFELATIQRAWDVVAEDYRPFNVDVTTELPNIEKLRKVGANDTEWGIQVMIGDPVEYNTGATGRAMTNSFNANYNAIVWVDLSDPGFTVQNARTVGGIAAHEVGHAVGLDHDRGSPGGEYYEGAGIGEADWSPIMGNIFPSSITTWSNGGYPTATNFEDDLTIISTQNGFTYRPDDIGDTPAQAMPLASVGPGHWVGEGIIERNTDYDLFSFVSTGGSTRISIAPTSVSPDVDLRAELYDSAMNLVAVSDVTDQLAASFEQPLTAGTYYVRVTGTGNRTWATGGYDDYASLGEYAVEIGGFGNLATFIPSGSTNSSTPLAGTTRFGGVTIGGLTQHATSGSTNTDAWPIGWDAPATQDPNEYVSFTVTPSAGSQLDFKSLTVNLKSWVGSNSNVAIRSSRDNFSTNIDGTRTLIANAGSDFAFNVTSVADSSSTVEFRLYVWGGGFGFRDLHSLNLTGRTLLTAPPVNVAPVANNDAATTNLNTAVTIGVLANDTDANGDVLTVQSIGLSPTHGTILLNANTTITYTPNTGFSGSDSFTYTATDGLLTSNTATVTITVANVASNTAPVAVNDTATTNEDTVVSINVLSNDTDAEGQPLTPSLVTQPAHGTVTVNADGTLNYFPALNYNGTDSFTYRVSDGLLNSNTATVAVTIVPVNDPPVATGDSASTTQNVGVTISVLSNDHDVDGDLLTPSIVARPAHGSATVNADGTVTYTPASSFTGNDTFTYLVSDGLLTSNTVTVSITVGSLPSLNLVKSTYSPGEVIVATFTNGPGNANDWIGIYSLGATPGSVSSTAWYYTNGSQTAGGSLKNGIVSLDAGSGAGNLAAGNYFATFLASDGYTELAPRVTFTVAVSNIAPVAGNDSVNTNEDTAVSINVLSNDSDADGQSLVPSIVTQAAHGTATVNVNGTVTYVPSLNFNGTDVFTYRVTDGIANSNTATVSITVAAVNDAPVAAGDSVSTNKNVGVTINVLANDIDVDGDVLTPSVLTQPLHGTVTVNANKTITYAPVVGYIGHDSFTYSVSDGLLSSSPVTVDLSVNDVLISLAHFDPVGSQGSANLHGSSSITGMSVGDLSRVGATYGTNTDDWPVYWNGRMTIDLAQYLSFTVTSAATDMAVFSKLTVSFQEWVTGTSNVAIRTSLDGFTANVGGVQILTDTGSADVMFDLSTLGPAVGTTTFRIYLFDTVDATTGWRDIRSSLWNNGHGVLLEGSTIPNTAPVAGNDAVTTNEDTAVTISVLGNGSDVDGQSLTPSILTQPAHGTVTVSAGGTVIYTPSLNFNGTDSFTYRVTDGALYSNAATVGVSVAAVNDAPNTVNDAYTTNYGVSINIPASTGVLANDSDVEGATLTASLITGPTHGLLTLNADGSFQYSPNAGYVGSDSFTYSASDGLLLTPATVSITVVPPIDDYGNFPNSTATSIPLSGGSKGHGSISGAFELPGDRDVFQVTVVKGILTIGLNGLNGLDTYLRVYNSSGSLIAENDDNGLSTSSVLVINVAAGTYYLSAGSHADSFTGSYTLTVDQRAQVTATFQQGVNGYTGSSDTYVSGHYPTSNFATWTINEVEFTTTSVQEQSLLQFKNMFGSGTGQIPFGSEVVSATLTFYVSNGGNRVNIHRMLTPWTDTATWNSMVSGIQTNGVEAVATPDAQTPLPTPVGWQSIDVKSSLVAWLANPASNFGWAFLPTGTDEVDFYSVNNNSYWVPRISVDYLAPNGDLHANTPTIAATSLVASSNHASAFGTLETLGDRDVFQFTLTQTRTVTINLNAYGTSSSSLDTYLRLYNSLGYLIGENDDTATSTNSSITLTLGPGTYFVSVAAYLDLSVGDYWLDLFL